MQRGNYRGNRGGNGYHYNSGNGYPNQYTPNEAYRTNRNGYSASPETEDRVYDNGGQDRRANYYQRDGYNRYHPYQNNIPYQSPVRSHTTHVLQHPRSGSYSHSPPPPATSPPPKLPTGPLQQQQRPVIVRPPVVTPTNTLSSHPVRPPPPPYPPQNNIDSRVVDSHVSRQSSLHAVVKPPPPAIPSPNRSQSNTEVKPLVKPAKSSLMKFKSKAQVKKTAFKPKIKAIHALSTSMEDSDLTNEPLTRDDSSKANEQLDESDIDTFVSKLAQDKSDSQSVEYINSDDDQSSAIAYDDVDMDDDDGHDDDDDDDDPMRLLRTINEKNKKNIPEHEPSTEKFDKCLYQESQFISDLTDEEIKALRLREGITIRGKRAVRPVLTWSQLGIPTSILSVIENLGYDSPTTIQGEALPNIMSGNDLIGIAKTGSGKTLAFLLPLFRQLISSSKTGGIISGRATPRALIMTPTRELALQILKESKPFLDMLDLKGCCCYGGQPINQQIAELKKGCNLIVATPGRLMDLLCANGGRVLALNHVTYMVLDEADRMFDLGFEPQVMKIVNAVRPDRQTVLFSATFPYKMEGLARKILIKPVEILVGSKNLVNEKIEQKFELLDDVSLKFNKLLQVLGHFREQDADGKILIFVDRQDSCDTLVSRLIARGYPSMSLHGGKEQVDRDSTISDFKNGIIDTLVATSVASRGLDVKDLSLVINYDPPSHMEDYIHRVGRTGRAGNSGTSITFITPNEDRSANDIAKLFEISGSPVPEKLLELANKFREKLNKGDVKFSSGFGGKGLEKLQAIREHNKSIEKQLYDKGDDDGEEKRESDSNKKSTEPSKAMSTAEVSAATAAADIDLNDFKVVYGSAKKGPDSSNYHAKLNINDLPKNPRWLVSNRESISKVVEATSTSITTKGRYYPPGKEPGEKEDAKLYLLIEGESEHSVRTAVELFKETLVKALNAHIKEDKGKKFTIS